MVTITIRFPDNSEHSTLVTPTTTVRELLLAVKAPIEGIIVYNLGDTPIFDLDRTMVDYNNWYVEHGSIPGLYILYDTSETTLQ